jgi:hypothetical protein
VMITDWKLWSLPGGCWNGKLTAIQMKQLIIWTNDSSSSEVKDRMSSAVVGSDGRVERICEVGLLHRRRVIDVLTKRPTSTTPCLT